METWFLLNALRWRLPGAGGAASSELIALQKINEHDPKTTF